MKSSIVAQSKNYTLEHEIGVTEPIVYICVLEWDHSMNHSKILTSLKIFLILSPTHLTPIIKMRDTA